MIDEIQERTSELAEKARDEFTPEPDELNRGISQTENLIAFITALAAGLAARNMLQASWRQALDRDPPKNPSSTAVDWKEALAWGALSGALVGVTRIAARRGSTSLYRQVRR